MASNVGDFSSSAALSVEGPYPSESTYMLERLDKSPTASRNPLLSCYLFKINGMPLWRWSILMGCAMMVCLQSGTTNAFNPLSVDIKKDQDIDSSLITVLSSLGLLGMFFTLPVGLLNDRSSPFVTCLMGGLLASTGYLAMSFTDKDTFWAMCISFTVVGFGSGAVTIAGLSTGVMANPKRPGLGIAPIAACISISLALTNEIVIGYAHATGCTDHGCYDQYLRFLAIMTGVFIVPFSFGLLLLPTNRASDTTVEEIDDVETLSSSSLDKGSTIEKDTMNPPIRVQRSISRQELLHSRMKDQEAKRPVSLLFSLQCLRNVFFLLLIYAFFAGIGSGLLIITGASTLWDEYTDGKRESWSTQILTIFSVVNMVFNLGSGFVCDFLWNKFKFPRQRVLALVLVYTTIVYLGLFVMTIIGTAGLLTDLLYGSLMIAVAAGFGCYFSLIPMIVGDFYGGANFGLYFSYIQIGSTIATFAVPNISDALHSYFGNNIVPLSLVAFASGTAGIGIWFKEPTPIGRF